jgi:tetratricopeptide (TPR) repeat protein
MKGNYAEAIQLYTRAIEINDNNAIYFSNRKLSTIPADPCLLGAQAYIMIEDFAKAIEDCDSAIKIDPSHTKVSANQRDCPSDSGDSHTTARQCPCLRALKPRTLTSSASRRSSKGLRQTLKMKI